MMARSCESTVAYTQSSQLRYSTTRAKKPTCLRVRVQLHQAPRAAASPRWPTHNLHKTRYPTTRAIILCIVLEDTSTEGPFTSSTKRRLNLHQVRRQQRRNPDKRQHTVGKPAPLVSPARIIDQVSRFYQHLPRSLPLQPLLMPSVTRSASW